MQAGDRVTLTDSWQTHFGTVITRHDNGMLGVKWDSGMTERIHESEVTEVTGPVAEHQAIQVGPGSHWNPDELAYEQDDPKHPTFRERMSALWDMRPGK